MSNNLMCVHNDVTHPGWLQDHMKLLQREKECFERKADESMELRRELTKLTKYVLVCVTYRIAGYFRGFLFLWRKLKHKIFIK